MAVVQAALQHCVHGRLETYADNTRRAGVSRLCPPHSWPRPGNRASPPGSKPAEESEGRARLPAERTHLQGRHLPRRKSATVGQAFYKMLLTLSRHTLLWKHLSNLYRKPKVFTHVFGCPSGTWAQKTPWNIARALCMEMLTIVFFIIMKIIKMSSKRR